MDGSRLAQAREQLSGVSSSASSGKRSERVWKLFTDQDKAEAIKAQVVEITIGSGAEARKVRIRPMNPRQLVASYGLIRTLLLPLTKVFTPNADGSPKPVDMGELLEAVGTNIDKVPELVYEILRRGNEISLDWINDNLDILIDLQLIIPVFLQQNGLGKLLGNDQGVDAQTPLPQIQTNDEETHPLTAV